MLKRVVISYFWVGSILFAQSEEPIPDLTEQPQSARLKQEPKVKEKQELPSSARREVTYSVNRMFHVYGGTAGARTNVVKVAEDVRMKLLQELKEDPTEKDRTPVQIVLEGDPLKKEKGNAYRRLFGEKPSGGYYLQLSVHQGREITKEGLSAAIAEMLLLERSLSSQDGLVETAEIVLHAWMIDGLLEVMEWRTKKADRRHYAELASEPKLFDLTKLLDVKRADVEKMDAATTRSYRAAAGAMVMALLKQPEGLAAMQKMLEELSLFQGEMKNLLKRHFPELNKGRNGERVAWLLQLNEMAMTPLTDSLSIIETEKKLNEVLLMRVLTEEGTEEVFAVEDFEAIVALDDDKRKAAVALSSRRLVQLNFRCFPLYRSMLFQYGTVLNALSEGQTKGVGELVQRLSDERKLHRQAALRGRDYLDWFVLQNATNVTGNYNQFKVLDKQLQEDQKAKMNSSMDIYLDRLDSFYK